MIIYFLLLYLAMSIVGFFIITNFQKIQIDMNSKNQKQRVSSMYALSNAFTKDDWINQKENIRESVNGSIQIGYNERVYIILNDDKKTVLASSVNGVIECSAYEVYDINSKIVVHSSKGISSEKIVKNENENIVESHISYPVKNNEGEIKGYIYLINDINYIYDTVNKSKVMLTKTTMMVLVLTVFLGLILSGTITGPIKELTLTTRKMSQGNFNHKYKIKSNDEIGELGMAFNYLTDELTKNISKLKQEKSKVETTFKYMADGVLTVDLAGIIIHMNPVARRILSCKIKDTDYDKIISLKTKNMTVNHLKKYKYKGTHTLLTESETYKIDYAPFKDGLGKIGGVILVFKNVTEQVKMDNLQKEFVANVSHELKTPITTIKSYAETLLEGAMQDENVATGFLEVINSESDRMTRLVRDLLKLSKMDFEETKWKKEVISVNEIIKLIHMKLIFQANNKNISLLVDFKDKKANVYFDKDGLEQILLNIVGNAIKYTPEGGCVIIEEKCIANKVNILIKDNGIGIPKEDILRVFERFYRVDKARTRKLGGTGLGLSIACQIAKAHDSNINIESELSKGTIVKVTIPKYIK